MAVIAVLGTFAARPALAAADLDVNWGAFLDRQTPVWRRLPTRFTEGPFLGNGLLGAVIYRQDPDGLAFDLGRSDVTDHRVNPDPSHARARLPIGQTVLRTAGEISGIDGRLSLWDAEFSAAITTTRGRIRLKAFVHATLPVMVVQTEAEGGEAGTSLGVGARFLFRPALCVNDSLILGKRPLSADDLNPAPYVEEHGLTRVSIQSRASGGEHAVAWQERAMGPGKRIYVLSIANSFPAATARRDAVAAVEAAFGSGLVSLRASHQSFWHRYYPQSFVSIPDPTLESFYWLQMYKLAAGTRSDRPALDSVGPWYHKTTSPGLSWNQNVQMAYWPIYTANRTALGESFLGLIDRNRDSLRKNVPEPMRAGAAAVGRFSGPDAVAPVSGPDPSNLVWALHNYWLHYRHHMDDNLLRDRLYPILREAINHSLQLAKMGADGRWHMPLSVSPEYPTAARDTNYDLSLLRWGCQTLIAAAVRLGVEDPFLPRWRDTLARLASFPEGRDGFLIGRDVPLSASHRYFSHLLMIYPLHLVTGRDAAERALVERSLGHWIGFEGASQGAALIGASAISSVLGKGDQALGHLTKFVQTAVKPNTMSADVHLSVGTPIAAAQALHELLLQSWGDRIRVFPALPTGWSDVAFHDLRTQGAFLVSAVRRQGRLSFIRIISQAGEPCEVSVPGVDLRVLSTGGKVPASRRLADGALKINLARGESVILVPASVPDAPVPVLPYITPVVHPTPATPAFGLP